MLVRSCHCELTGSLCSQERHATVLSVYTRHRDSNRTAIRDPDRGPADSETLREAERSGQPDARIAARYTNCIPDCRDNRETPYSYAGTDCPLRNRSQTHL